MKFAGAVAAVVVVGATVSACAGPTIWDKAGGTQEEFNRDTYACQKDAYAMGGTSAVYYGYGIASARPTPNVNLYNSCMVSKGYTPRGKG